MGGTPKSVKAIKGKFSAARYGVQMGCETPIIKDRKSVEYLELRQRGQLLRGDFLDAFARLESAVMQYIGRTDVKASPGQPFSQKLVLLQKARERFRNPKRLDVRIAAIQQLLPVRADIVHSILEAAILFDGRATSERYCFRNSSNAISPPRLIEGDELIAMTRRLNQLAHQFSQQRLKEAGSAAPAG
ncbi:MAG TPA: hypothetical protein VEZ59_12100 [Sphingopyxis sp.]|nr:hypothetical protein [Sphingopyxis sp.]